MHKGEYIRCIRLSYGNNPDSTYYGKYAKYGAIWVKSTEIVTLEYNDGYVYNSWKDADSGTTKPDFTRIVHLTLSNGKELNVLNTEEFDLELQSDES